MKPKRPGALRPCVLSLCDATDSDGLGAQGHPRASRTEARQARAWRLPKREKMCRFGG